MNRKGQKLMTITLSMLVGAGAMYGGLEWTGSPDETAELDQSANDKLHKQRST